MKLFMKNTALLHEILSNQQSSAPSDAETLRNICVFDLDSTLFNVAPRTEQILKEFGDVHNLPDFKKIKVNPKDWGLKEILIREGYNLSDSKIKHLHQDLIEFWSHKFFSNEYLHYDTPYLGAVHFVQTLFEKNIDVHYLTGRDISRMGHGTREVLLKWGFPILSDSHLHLKPHKDMDDHKFKLDWIFNFKNHSNSQIKNKVQSSEKKSEIFFFENEPVNINTIGNAVKDLKIIYLNTTHSRKENIQVPVIEIENFLLDTEMVKSCST